VSRVLLRVSQKREIAIYTASLSTPHSTQIDYQCATPIQHARWVVTYTVDMTATKTVLHLGTTEPRTCESGATNFLKFHCDAIDVAGVKQSALHNVSVLTASLVDDGGGELAKVVCVTQVTKTGEGLTRNVISLLE
jgi:hypothetical protein